ncbi:IS110 family transposase [Grimontia hollisae]|uniref:IS110 family transposase n=1 Tax=Grimontia hollisae TaxID=673 RepID=UPI000DFA24B5|nr:IS110 family transposase [Grimontia hollisae]STQ74853.1 Transposase IS116/IS110/IS902 family [Grimontia hollisae]STQ75822.1 Transposase IS116/IS110/IS902 family [Grimontia hollisae]STQ76450.1 Transposase IS116/IS110/IS902 family [Grimontia hollisae]STR61872.1 Transposase IS116/IS110/IS902 family [Grimontia hollisae]
MNIVTLGIDLAKSSFALHGVDSSGKVLLRKNVSRKKLPEMLINMPPCLVGMEACSSAHYWARLFKQFGHDVKLMPPQFVKPYVKSNKNDTADAEAICEAVTRPNMRFVPIKSIEQQSILSIHKARERLVSMKTGQTNQLRGLLAEFGIVIPKGSASLNKQIPLILENAGNNLTSSVRRLVAQLKELIDDLVIQICVLTKEIEHWHSTNVDSKRIAEIPGIGPITATALVASIGDPASFNNGRQVSAWIGLVPKQFSTGGKQVLLGISKRGDSYLRRLLVHGARAVLGHLKQQPNTYTHRWLNDLLKRKHKNVAIVALANRNARIAWALLANQQQYNPELLSA